MSLNQRLISVHVHEVVNSICGHSKPWAGMSWLFKWLTGYLIVNLVCWSGRNRGFQTAGALDLPVIQSHYSL